MAEPAKRRPSHVKQFHFRRLRVIEASADGQRLKKQWGDPARRRLVRRSASSASRVQRRAIVLTAPGRAGGQI